VPRAEFAAELCAPKIIRLNVSAAVFCSAEIISNRYPSIPFICIFTPKATVLLLLLLLFKYI